MPWRRMPLPEDRRPYDRLADRFGRPVAIRRPAPAFRPPQAAGRIAGVFVSDSCSGSMPRRVGRVKLRRPQVRKPARRSMPARQDTNGLYRCGQALIGCVACRSVAAMSITLIDLTARVESIGSSGDSNHGPQGATGRRCGSFAVEGRDRTRATAAEDVCRCERQRKRTAKSEHRSRTRMTRCRPLPDRKSVV